MRLLKTTIDLVREFHTSFAHPVASRPTTRSDNIVLQDLRVDLLEEELKELKDALHDDNIVEVFDALLDMQYVLDGAFLVFGLGGIKMQGFSTVHASNMSKLDADGNPIYRPDGKVLKGSNYFPPTPILEDLIKAIS